MGNVFEPEQLCFLRPVEVQEEHRETLEGVNTKVHCITKQKDCSSETVSSFESWKMEPISV